MAATFTLYEKGYFSGGIKLVYNYTNQLNYKMRYGMQMQAPETEVQTHTPDDGDTQPINAIDRDRVFFFNLHILSDQDNDELLNALNRLMRMADGANQPGLRHHLLNDTNEIFLRAQLDGTTNYTDHSIKWGFVDAGEAIYTSGAILNEMAQDVVVALRLPPYSEGAAITLHNDLSNGDFLVESSTSGLAQDWSMFGTATLTLDSEIHLVNGVSQKVSVGATGTHGVASATVSASGGAEVSAFAWVYIESGDAVSLFLTNQTLGTTIDGQHTHETGLTTIHDRNGNTWVRLEASGALGGGDTGARIVIERHSSNATQATVFHADAAYLQVGTQTAPSGGWVSFCNLDNRADELNTTMGRRNWLDLALIPGDAPALVRYKTNSDPSSGDSWYLARYTDGKVASANNVHWIDSDQFSDPIGEETNGSWSTDSSATYSGGSAFSFLASGGVGSGTIRYLPTGDDARYLFNGPKVLYVQCSSDDGTLASSVSFDVNNAGGAGGASPITSRVKIASSNLHIIPVGTLNLQLPEGDEIPDSTEPDSVSLDIDVSAVPDGNDINIDGLWLFPAHVDEFTIWRSILSGTNAWFDGKHERIVESQLGISEPQVLGSQRWRLEPGNVTNRIIFVWTTDRDTNEVDVTSTNDVTVELWPRTRQLLGVV